MQTGTLLFCPDCGTLLNLPIDNEPSVICEQCKHEEPATCTSSSRSLHHANLTHFPAYENIETTTRSHPEAFPSALRQKRKIQTKQHEADADLLKVSQLVNKELVFLISLKVTEKCPECGHLEAFYKEKQVCLIILVARNTFTLFV